MYQYLGIWKCYLFYGIVGDLAKSKWNNRICCMQRGLHFLKLFEIRAFIAVLSLLGYNNLPRGYVLWEWESNVLNTAIGKNHPQISELKTNLMRHKLTFTQSGTYMTRSNARNNQWRPVTPHAYSRSIKHGTFNCPLVTLPVWLLAPPKEVTPKWPQRVTRPTEDQPVYRVSLVTMKDLNARLSPNE